MTFAQKITELTVAPGQVALVWIGQAGFLMKTASGKVIVIDPCLTDYVYQRSHQRRGQGFKRLVQALFQPGELNVDYMISSHEHDDHLEVPWIPDYLEYPNAQIWCNEPGTELLRDANIPLDRVRALKKGEVIRMEDCTLYVTDCDHGEGTPHALGFVFDFGFTKIYYSGDTALTPERLRQPLSMQPEIALLPINGEFGNLNSEEAARYSAMLHSKCCVPHHFFTFALHGGDPREAIQAFPEYAPDCELKLMTPGDIWMIGE